MYLICLLGSWLGGSDVDRLGSDDWREREAAQYRLGYLWPAQLGELLAAERGSESPEVRSRAGVALRPWRTLCREFCAAAVLGGHAKPTALQFWHDHPARLRVYRQAVALGCSPYTARVIHPDGDQGGWVGDWTVAEDCLSAVAECRAWIADAYTAPMPRVR